MILTLEIKLTFHWGWTERCIRVLEIEDTATLFDLHDAIQDAVGFDRDHLFHFFVANSDSPHAHRHLLSEAETYEGWVDEFKTMPLSDIWPLKPRKKLFYLFDFGDQWTFLVTKRRGVKKPEAGVSYPRVIERTGPDPVQY